MSRNSEQRALEAYPELLSGSIFGPLPVDLNKASREKFQEGYEQAEKDIKEATIKHFKYKQDHSPEHTLHWWVYKNVIDKVNEL